MANLPDVKIRLLLENGQLRAGLSGTQAQFNQFAQQVASSSSQTAQSIASIEGRVNNLASTMEGVKQLGATFLTFAAIKGMVGSLVSAQLQLQEIKYGLEAATGSAEAGAAEFQYLSETADRVGVRLVQAGQAYSGYLVAAKAANLTTAESRDLFTSVTEAGAVFNLSQERMGSAMLALQQMMGMGVIKSQELRYQLGSALPGAFSRFKAEVEKNGIDFEKALSGGDLDVKTFAPMLTKAIESLYSQEALEGAANDLNSQLAKMENSIVRFKQSFTEGDFTEYLSMVLGTTSKTIEAIAEMNSGIGGSVAIYATVAAVIGATIKSINMLVDKGKEYAASFREATILARDGAKIEAQAAVQREAAAVAQAESAQQSLTIQQLELQVQRDKLLLSEATLAAKEAEALAAVRSAEAAGADAAANGTLAKAQAQLSAVQTERALVQARLNALTTQDAVVSAESAAASTARLQAEARLGQALVARTVAEGRVATATEATAIASGVAARQTLAQATASGTAAAALTVQARATGILTAASAGLATVGRGLLALLGGLPGLAIAAGAGLIYLATKATEAEKVISELGQSIKDTGEQFKKLVATTTEFRKLRTEMIAANEAFQKDPTDTNREALIRSAANFRRSREALIGAASQGEDAAYKAVQVRVSGETALNKLLERRAQLQKELSAAARAPQTGREGGLTQTQRVQAALDRNEKEIENQRRMVAALRVTEQKAAAAAKSTSGLAGQEKATLDRDTARAEAAKLVQSAITSSEAAIQEAKAKSATIDEKVAAAQQAALKTYRAQAEVGQLTAEQRAKDETALLGAIERKVRAEEASTKTGKAKATVDREGAKAAQELERANDATARGEERLQELERQGVDGRRRQNAINEQMAASLRQVDDAVRDATNAINESKISDEDKAKRLATIATAADNARESIKALADYQRQEAANEIALRSKDDIFQSENSKLGQSSDPRDREQAERDRVNYRYDQQEDELNQRLGDRPDSQEYLDGLAAIQEARSAALDAMVTETEQRAQDMEAAMLGSMQNTIQGILTGAVTLKQGLMQMFSDILQAYIQKMVTEPLAQAAMRWMKETALGKLFMTQQVALQTASSAQATAVKSAESASAVAGNAATAASGAAASQASIPIIGPGLAIAAMVAMLAAVMALKRKNKAAGGLITGPGTGTSDDVPINASNGEFMVKATSVKKYGVGFLESVNSGRLQVSPINSMRKVHGYAEGGLINPNGPRNVSQPGGVQEGDRAGPGIRVINVMDPRLLEDYVNSPEGERTIMNVLEKNPRRVKQMIG